MKWAAPVGIGCSILLMTAAYAEHLHFESNNPASVIVADPAHVELQPAPINAAWILSGNPDTRAGEVAHSKDGTTQVYVWQTTGSRFNWFYDFDEIITVVDGEVFIAEEGKAERHLKPGDAAFFPKGARTTWRVPDHLRKIATVKKPLPGPLADALRWVRSTKAWLSGAPSRTL